ncbi:hypothetical protein V7087_16745 [Neobacillus niacini]|uniref:hypothetical protein n=1 Tax=Neobacillus niacini TaxID=86668 RepID=UPI0030008936
MNILIQISYTSNDNKVMHQGSFPLKRKTKEEVAFEFWSWIKKEHPYECEIEKVIVDGEDITEKVKELAKAPLD